jgi:hypothetical protein
MLQVIVDQNQHTCLSSTPSGPKSAAALTHNAPIAAVARQTTAVSCMILTSECGVPGAFQRILRYSWMNMTPLDRLLLLPAP